MKTEGVLRLTEIALAFAEDQKFPTMIGGDKHSDAIQAMCFAIKGLTEIVKTQQLLIDSQLNTNKGK